MKTVFLVICGMFLSISAFAQSENNIPKEWKKFSNEGFSFFAPSNLKKQDIRGIDSLAEAYKNDDRIVEFDYGWYENDAANCSNPIAVTIDKKSARICFYEDEKFDKDKPFVTAVAFPKLGSKRRTNLTFWVLSKTKDLQKEAEKIVRSIKFK